MSDDIIIVFGSQDPFSEDVGLFWNKLSSFFCFLYRNVKKCKKGRQLISKQPNIFSIMALDPKKCHKSIGHNRKTMLLFMDNVYYIIRYCQRYHQIWYGMLRYRQILSDIVLYQEISSDIVGNCIIPRDIIRYCHECTCSQALICTNLQKQSCLVKYICKWRSM